MGVNNDIYTSHGTKLSQQDTCEWRQQHSLFWVTTVVSAAVQETTQNATFACKVIQLTVTLFWETWYNKMNRWQTRVCNGKEESLANVTRIGINSFYQNRPMWNMLVNLCNLFTKSSSLFETGQCKPKRHKYINIRPKKIGDLVWLILNYIQKAWGFLPLLAG